MNLSNSFSLEQLRDKHSNYMRKWRVLNKERNAATRQRFKQKLLATIGIDGIRKRWREEKAIEMNDPKKKIRLLLRMAKKRAVQKGLEFSISINDLLPFPEICEVFGTKINYRAIVKKGGAVSDSPSIDRINTNLGYIKGNVKIISWRANRIKSDATVDELRKVVAYAAQQ